MRATVTDLECTWAYNVAFHTDLGGVCQQWVARQRSDVHVLVF
jgi:hypothetical protein